MKLETTKTKPTPRKKGVLPYIRRKEKTRSRAGKYFEF